VLFPENAVLCLMTVMSNGDTIEAATVGREGASWISASVGAPSMPCETIVVIEGTALRLPIADLDRELKENGHFRDILTEYSHALLMASMRTSACNGLHGLQQRCARWILMTLDRVDSDGFKVTKEFLAQLLGTNRPTVSVLVSELEKAGIQGERPPVTVADRAAEEAARECYDIIRKNYDVAVIKALTKMRAETRGSIISNNGQPESTRHAWPGGGKRPALAEDTLGRGGWPIQLLMQRS
jgi:hypothetical protein